MTRDSKMVVHLESVQQDAKVGVKIMKIGESDDESEREIQARNSANQSHKGKIWPHVSISLTFYSLFVLFSCQI